MKLKYGVIFGGLIIVFWIALIFYFSSQSSVSSNQQSEKVHAVYDRLNAVFDFSDNSIFIAVKSFVFEDLLNRKDYSTSDKIRKSAHIAIYFVLGILATFFGWAYTKKWLIAVLMGVCLPTTVAVVDEFYQGLIDRTSLVNDVVLDSVSATLGMCFALLIIGGKHIIKKLDLFSKTIEK